MVVNCHKCPATFATQRDLERHLERKIPCDRGSFKCDDCSAAFTSKRSLNEHLKKARCKGKSLALVNQELMNENMQLRDQAEHREQLLDITNTEPSTQASSSTEEPSQPPVDTSPTIIDWPDCFEFGDKKIRKTSETPQRVSVYDLIAAMTDQDSNAASKAFLRLKQTYSEVTALSTNFKFAGRGQRDTPVTGAKGAVTIMNLLPGQKAAAFRVACVDIIVRYLGGDESLIGEIQRNRVVQATAAETSPIRLFGEAVTPSVVFHETSPLQLQSVTNVIDFRSPSVYTRQIFDRVSNVHPVGRPQDVVPAEELANLMVVKIGSQGSYTGRQVTHIKTFDRSKLLDSKLTSSYTHVETQAKDVWKNNGELYEGLFEGKTSRDIELLLVKDQPDYERQLKFYHQLCPVETVPLELQLAQETSRQMEADAEARKADACKAEADAEARKKEADAEARKADAEARKADAEARKAEAETRKAEIDMEMWKMKNAQV